MIKIYFNTHYNLAVIVSEKTKRYKVAKLNSIRITNANFYQSTIHRIGEIIEQSKELNYGRA